MGLLPCHAEGSKRVAPATDGQSASGADSGWPSRERPGRCYHRSESDGNRLSTGLRKFNFGIVRAGFDPTLGHPTTWTRAENLLTLGARASGRD